jgi:xylulokinase
MDIVKTTIDQQAAALGAAACAAVGTGLWKDFEIIDRLHQVEDVSHPVEAHTKMYRSLLPVFDQAENHLADLGDRILENKIS